MRLVVAASVLGALVLSPLAAQRPPRPPRPPDALRIDPRLIAEAEEVWSVIATARNPIWPGWDASRTPLLLYSTGVQDVLINHPRPPQDFRPYTGPVRFARGRGRIWLRDGATFESLPGQNTSSDFAGERTLVVADPEPGSSAYEGMAVIAHEAFHVFQDHAAPDRGANAMALTAYPVLAVQNNVGFALEGAALAAGLRAGDGRALRAALVRWLAVRRDRRASLGAAAVEYEDATEFSEGLAKYVEYRLLESLQGRRPQPAMWWTRGFHGYGDLSPERAQLTAMMLRHMRGEINVNDDPYGTAPLRMRLYYSGMALGVALDQLVPDWKVRILKPSVSLTQLVEQGLRADSAELARSLDEAHREPGYDSLIAAKTGLAERGRARTDSLVAAIEHGPGTGIVIDYGGLATPRVALAFTPFGVTVVDSTRTIFAQVPIRAQFPDGSEVVQSVALPVLRDVARKTLTFRLPRELSPGELARALAADSVDVTLDLPGVRIHAIRAAINQEGRDLRIVLR